mmetsp:Transcript_28296/g.31439  ORF Transcript_28296/g.31439 Transcript_28296/m.31439 type:complete len:166 (+) Transcript_28296:28-525(+)
MEVACTVKPSSLIFEEDNKEQEINLYNPNDFRVAYTIQTTSKELYKFPDGYKGFLSSKKQLTVKVVLKQDKIQDVKTDKLRVKFTHHESKISGEANKIIKMELKPPAIAGTSLLQLLPFLVGIVFVSALINIPPSSSFAVLSNAWLFYIIGVLSTFMCFKSHWLY